MQIYLQSDTMDLDYRNFTIILPTLNEEENIAKIIGILTRSYKGINILVSDDGSTDRTKSIVDAISAKNRRVKFLDRRGSSAKGLTASIIEGFEKITTAYGIVMDADMQHPTEEVAKIAMNLSRGDDISVGVRAKFDNWELYRKIISRILVTLSYIILLVRGKQVCSDVFAGYFGARKKLVVSIVKENRKRFVNDGQKMLFDLLKCIDRGTIRISEVPYTFHQRKAGTSKAGVKHAIALLQSYFS